MNKLELLNKLGFKEYESKIYLTLSKFGTLTVSQINKESQVPRNKIYESLENLRKKNKISIIPTFPKKYQIINEEALEEEAKQILNTTSQLIKEIQTPKTENPEDFFSILKGRKAVQAKLRYSNKNVKSEILSSNKLSNILPNNIKALKDSIDRGVKVKFITTFDPKKEKNYLAYMKSGAKIRIFDEKKFGYIMPRISIHDKKITRITIGEPEIKNGDDYITIWTTSKIFSASQYAYLNDIWKKCEPIENYLK